MEVNGMVCYSIFNMGHLFWAISFDGWERIIKPQSAKAKGRNLQKLVRDLILELNPELEPDDVQSRSMGAGGEDVMLSPAARKYVPFQIECKNQKQVTVYKWYDQAVEHGKYPALLVIKQNHREPLVIIDAVLLFKLLRRNFGQQQVSTPST